VSKSVPLTWGGKTGRSNNILVELPSNPLSSSGKIGAKAYPLAFKYKGSCNSFQCQVGNESIKKHGKGNRYDLMNFALDYSKCDDILKLRNIIRRIDLDPDIILDLNKEYEKFYLSTCKRCGVLVPNQIRAQVKSKALNTEIGVQKIRDLQLDSKKFSYDDIFSNGRVNIPQLFKVLPFLSKGEVHKLLLRIIKDSGDNFVYTYMTNSRRDFSKLRDCFFKNNFVVSMNLLNDKQINKKKYMDRNLDRIDKYSFIAQSAIFSAGNKLNDLLDRVSGDVDRITSEAPPLIRKVDGVADDVKVCVSNAENVINKIDGFCPTLNKITKITNRLEEGCDFITDLAKSVKSTFSNFDNSFINMVIKLISFAYLISQKANQTLTNILALSSLILTDIVSANCQYLIDNLVLAVQGIIVYLNSKVHGVIEQFDLANFRDRFKDFSAQTGDSSFVQSIFDIIKITIGGIFGDIPKPVFEQLKMSMKKVSAFSAIVKNASSLVEYFGKAISFSVEIIGDYVLEYYGYLPEFLKADNIDDYLERFRAFKKNDYAEQSKNDMFKAGFVRQLYNDLMDYEVKLTKKLSKSSVKDRFIVLPYIKAMRLDVEKAFNNLPDYFKKNTTARRNKPFWVYIHGEPRIGKTATFQPWLINTLAFELGICVKYQDPYNYCNFRNCGSEFWESYHSQPTVVYNDLFQTYSDEQLMYTAIREITDVIDDNPFELNKAFGDKGKSYFSSELVVSNAQSDIVGTKFTADKCLSQGKHIYSRRNIVVELVLMKKYRQEGPNPINLKLCKDNITFCEGDKPIFKVIPKDLYELRFTCPSTGIHMFTMNFSEGMDYIVDSAKEHFKISNEFKDALFSAMKDIYPQSGMEDFMPSINKKLYDSESEEECQSGMDRYIPVHLQVNKKGLSKKVGSSSEDDSEVILQKYFEYEKDLNFIGFEPYSLEHLSVITEDGLVELQNELYIKEPIYEKIIRKCKEAYDKCKKVTLDFLKNHPKWCIFVGVSSIVALIFTVYKLNSKRSESSNIENSITALTSEHDKSRAKIKRIRKNVNKQQNKKGEINIVDPQTYNDSNRDIEVLLRNATCRATLVVEKDSKKVVLPLYQSLMKIGGQVFMCPKHFWYRLKSYIDIYLDKGDKFWVRLTYPYDKFVDIDFDLITELDPLDLESSSHCTDVIFLHIATTECGRNLTKFFTSVEEQPSLSNVYLYGCRSREIDSGVNTVQYNVNNVELWTVPLSYDLPKTRDPIHNLPVKEENVELPYHYMYIASTLAGDCGMLLMHTDNAVQGKILGMHVAGSVKMHKGVSIPIFKEDIEDVLLYFRDKKQNIVIQPQMDYVQVVDDPVSQSYLREFEPLNLNYVGVTPRVEINGKIVNIKRTLNTKTKIRKSLVFDAMEQDLGPHKHEPAKLARFTDEDGIHSPMYNALHKIGGLSAPVSKMEYDLILEHVIDSINSWTSPVSRRSVLNDFEMINGNEHLNPIDTTTSPGFPYTLYHSSEGKKPWFDRDTLASGKIIYSLKDSLRRDLEVREKYAALGECVQTYFVDCLKDELRPIQKVVQGKTRLFQIGPMDLSLLTRKYCGDFISFMHTTYLDGEVAIGINPCSSEWDLMMRNLLLFDKYLNGDYSNYDASLCHQIGEFVADVINAWYNDEFSVIRRTLILACFNGLHINNDIVYVFNQGNPSGCALTTIINSIANMFFIRLAYIRLTPYNLKNFHDYVKAKFFGDDNLIALHDAIAKYINMFNYTELMKSLGVTYTSPDKSTVVKPHYDRTELSFLKNKIEFVKNKVNDKVVLNKYIALLDMETVSEIARWSMSDPENVLDQVNRFNQTLYFLSNYGKLEFERFRSLFLKYMKVLREYGYAYRDDMLFTYQYAGELIYPDHYKLPNYFAISDKEQKLVVDYEGSNREVVKLLNDECIEFSVNNMFENINTGNISSILKMIPQSSEKDAHRARIKRIRKNTKNFKPQSGAVGEIEDTLMSNLPEHRDDHVEVEKVTTFIDTVTVHNPIVDIPNYIVDNAHPDVELHMFLSRPYQVASLTWTASQVIGTAFTAVIFPDAFFAIPAVVSKLAQIVFFRPEFEISVRVNGTPMHYGRIMFCWIPQAQVLNNTFKNYQNAWGNQWYQVSANSQQVTKFTIPYTHFKNYINVGMNNVDLFTLFPYVSVPLSSVNGTASSVNVTIFARMVLPRVAGYGFANDYTAQVGEKFDRNDDRKIISRAARKLSEFTEIFTRLPMIGSYASTATSILRAGSNIFSYIGLSVPPNLLHIHPMQIRMPRWNTSEDVPNTTLMNAFPDGEVEKHFGLVNDTEKGLDLLHFMSRPFMMYAGTITVADLAGSILYSQWVSPMMFVYSDYVTSVNPSSFVASPVAFASRYADVWRGGVRFHIAFIASKFHSMRVRMFYVPYVSGDSNVFPNPTELQTNDCLNMVIDIDSEKEVSFTIPFMQMTEWLNVGTGFNIDSGLNANGYWGLMVINELTAGAASVAPIYYQIFVSAASDFQLAVPNVNTGVQFIAQVGDFEQFVECEFPSASFKCLMETEYPVLGGKQMGHVAVRTHFPMEVTGIRQLANMVTPLIAFTPSSSAPNYQGVSFNYGSAPKYDGTEGFSMNNFLFEWMQVFRYYRGGVRLVGYNGTSGTPAAGWHVYLNYLQTTVPNLFGTVTTYSPTGNPDYWFYYSAYTINSGQTPLDVVVPNMCIYNCRLTQLAAGNTSGTFVNQGGVIASIGGFGLSSLVGIGAGDDFLYGFQIGAPLAKYT